MRETIQTDPPERTAKASRTRGASFLRSVRGYWKAYWKLALGMLLVAMLVLFVLQNANFIHVRFLAWEIGMSQALVVFLAVASGVVFGVVFNRWQRYRSSADR